MQIIAAAAFGAFLDWTRLSRRLRTGVAWAFMFVIVMAVWGGGYVFQLKTSRAWKGPSMDIFDNNYTWYLIVSFTVTTKRRDCGG